MLSFQTYAAFITSVCVFARVCYPENMYFDYIYMQLLRLKCNALQNIVYQPALPMINGSAFTGFCQNMITSSYNFRFFIKLNIQMWISDTKP